MNAKLKDFHKDQYTPSWIALLLVVGTYVINSYLILYLITPSIFLANLQSITYGYVRPIFIAFLLSLIFYPMLLSIKWIKTKSLIRLQNIKASIWIGTSFTVLLLLVQLPYISTESFGSREPGFWVGYLVELIFAAVAEEVLFRAFLLTSLIYLFKSIRLGKESVWLGVIISSVLFSVAHLPYHQKIGGFEFSYYMVATGVGILLCWTYIWFNNLILVSLLHLMCNITSLYLPLEEGGKGWAVLLWLAGMIFLSASGYRIKKYSNTTARPSKMQLPVV